MLARVRVFERQALLGHSVLTGDVDEAHFVRRKTLFGVRELRIVGSQFPQWKRGRRSLRSLETFTRYSSVQDCWVTVPLLAAMTELASLARGHHLFGV